MDNDAVLSDFARTYKEITRDKNCSHIFLTIRGNASVEGDADVSMTLANDRAWSLADYIISNYSISDSMLFVFSGKEPYIEAEKILAAFPDTISEIDLKSIKRITRSVEGSQIRRAFLELDGNQSETNWEWYKYNVLNPTRFAEISIHFSRNSADINQSLTYTEIVHEIKRSDDVDKLPSNPVLVQDPVPNILSYSNSETEPISESDSLPHYSDYRLGTNLLYDAATVANLSLEVGFAQHFAFNLLATFSPWDIKPDLKLRTLLFQPELRWYLAEGYRGHYFGLEGHYGWYNMAFGGVNRYQDEDGNTPLWGAGLTYGYVLPFGEHWGMDFSISAGYARLEYDGFYNLKNGACHLTTSRDWWGPTKLGVSIYYQF